MTLYNVWLLVWKSKSWLFGRVCEGNLADSARTRDKNRYVCKFFLELRKSHVFATFNEFFEPLY